MYLLIDESGTLPDINDSHIIMAGIYTNNIHNVMNFMKIVSKHNRKNKKEFKFYNMGHKSKVRFFKDIKDVELEVFILVINKMRRKISIHQKICRFYPLF